MYIKILTNFLLFILFFIVMNNFKVLLVHHHPRPNGVAYAFFLLLLSKGKGGQAWIQIRKHRYFSYLYKACPPKINGQDSRIFIRLHTYSYQYTLSSPFIFPFALIIFLLSPTLRVVVDHKTHSIFPL